MTDLVYDYISMGVDMMLSAAFLTAVIILMRSSTVLSSYSAQQQATTDRLNYYREYSMYDCTDNLLSPDALSTISYYRYDMDVVIVLKGTGGGSVTITNYLDNGNVHKYEGKYYKVVNGGIPVEINREELAFLIGSTKKFSCNIFEDFTDEPSLGGYQGGVITGIKFTEQ